MHQLASIDDNHVSVIEALVDELDAHNFQPKLQELDLPELRTGALTPETIASAIGGN